MISDKLPFVLFGGHYHPDHGPEPVWQEDVRLMRRAGVNLATVGVFSWARIQAGPETFDFGGLDRTFDVLHGGGGIGIALATGTACPPVWLGQRYPEILPVNRAGARLAGGQGHYCPNSAAYREWSGRWVRQLAGRYGPHPALVLWYVHNEHGCHFEACYCEACAGGFRRWLQDKYQTLEALNEQWGCGANGPWYHSWEEVQPVRLTPACANPALQLDYHRFASSSFLDCFLNEKKILKELTPQLPVTTNFVGDRALPKTLNCFEWAQHVDFVMVDTPAEPVEHSPADLAFALALQRGLGAGKPWVFVEQALGQAQRRTPRGLRKPGQTRLTLYQALAHGAEGVMLGRWRAPRGGLEKFHSAILPHGGSESEAFRDLSQIGFEFKKLAPLCGTRVAAEVGLVLDWENYWAVELEGRPARLDYVELVRHYYRALFEPDIAIDIISPESDLTPYKLIIVPALYLVRDGVAENFEDFLSRGGTLVMSFFSGLVDANDRIIPGGYPGAFRKLLGLHIEEMEPLPAGQTRHIRSPQFTAKCGLWADLIVPETAETVATFTEEPLVGRAALTRNAFGRGLAYYLGTQIEVPFLRTFFAGLCADSGIKPPLKVPEGIEVVRRSNAQNQFIFLLNHRPAPLHVDLGLLAGRDLLSGQEVSGHVPLRPHEVMVIQVENLEEGE